MRKGFIVAVLLSVVGVCRADVTLTAESEIVLAAEAPDFKDAVTKPIGVIDEANLKFFKLLGGRK